jgi:hypothetical protein
MSAVSGSDFGGDFNLPKTVGTDFGVRLQDLHISETNNIFHSGALSPEIFG